MRNRHTRPGMPVFQVHYGGSVTPARQSSQAPATHELARTRIERMVRDGTMDFDMARFQLEAIEAAVRSGRPILVVEDVDLATPERQRLTHAA